MKKVILMVLGTLYLAGCASTPHGFVFSPKECAIGAAESVCDACDANRGTLKNPPVHTW